MPRSPRQLAAHQTFHVVNRANNRQSIFLRDADFEYYLGLLFRYKNKFGILLHHYVIMPNHVHLLLQATNKPSDISAFMQGVTLSHTRTTNNRLKRSGHLWQGRFFCSLVENDSYFLQCGIYIELNPVRAGLVSQPQDYPWISYSAYASSSSSSLVDTHPFVSSLGTDDISIQTVYSRLVEQNLAEWRLKTWT